ncbi:MAG: arsenate reductase (glutaredoxin) [Pseudomonadota bacterium]
MGKVTIYHNPKCSNSRGALDLIREKGIEPEVVEYLKTPLSKAQLQALLQKLGISVRDVLREKEAAYQDLGLADPSLAEDVLLEAIVAHPVLMNRPIVVTGKGAALCRPPETVLGLLP